jgi:hypothetical protein
MFVLVRELQDDAVRRASPAGTGKSVRTRGEEV